LILTLACGPAACSRGSAQQTFAAPEDAVHALDAAVKTGDLNQVAAIFGPEGRALIDTSDAATARRNQQVFSAAMQEQWHLEGTGTTRVLIVGNEQWPFPVPIVADGSRWRFDTPAGKEEILARRIGQNELAAIRICETYVAAQRLYAAHAHDGLPSGVFAQTVSSTPGRHDGLYWRAPQGEKRSPLGDLVASAALDARSNSQGSSPFHGYYFRILTAQGPAAPGGAKDYITGGRMTGGFALVAWPAQYDVTGVMSFIVNQDGIVYERDFGPDTETLVRAVAHYDPDTAWSATR
jgi:hypothetical protein